MTSTQDLILAANWYLTRRHYTLEMKLDLGGDGLSGYALCTSDSNPVRVFDQEHHDAMAARYDGHKTKPIGALPLCKRCAKKATTLQSDEPPLTSAL